MSYLSQTSVAFAGMIGKGGASQSKATGEPNVGETPVSAGYFVAFVDGGIQELSAVTDTLAGVVVYSPVQDTYAPDEYLSVMHIGEGDSIFCALEGTAKRGDKVHVRVVLGSAKANTTVGAVLTAPVTDKTIPTDFVVLSVTDGLAEIGRL